MSASRVLFAMPWREFPEDVRESVISNLEFDAENTECSCFVKRPDGTCGATPGCEIRSAAFTAAAKALRGGERAAGIEAAAKLMEENAECFRKSGQRDIAYQLDAEARHIRELAR